MNGIELDSGMMKIVLPLAFDASIGGPGCTNSGIALVGFDPVRDVRRDGGRGGDGEGGETSGVQAARHRDDRARGMVFMSSSKLGDRRAASL